MLAEAGARILGIKGINEQSIERLHRSDSIIHIQSGSNRHLGGNPALANGLQKRLFGFDHGSVLYITKYFLSSKSRENFRYLREFGIVQPGKANARSFAPKAG